MKETPAETRHDGSGTAPDLISIGDLAELTGISPDTIRVWEKRYGRPIPVRLPSGHRRYSPKDIRWLRRIAQALAMGYRPSRLVRLTDEELDALLFPVAMKHEQRRQLGRLLELARGLQDRRLASELQRMLRRLGPHEFLFEVISPLLELVGRSWANGDIRIRHEHLLSEILQDLLRSIRLSIRKPSKGPRVVLATLSGETHGLGLQMVAILCRLTGVPTRILGVNTPTEEIVGSAVEAGAGAVALSVSLATGGVDTDRVIRSLREMLPPDIRLAVGGRGARGVRRGARGVDYFRNLETFETWLEGLKESQAKR